jgi:hypothetical protein
MKDALIHYEFINSGTGYIIGYLSFAAGMDEKERAEQLERKRTELAIFNKIYIELIYWQEKGHGVR